MQNSLLPPLVAGRFAHCILRRSFSSLVPNRKPLLLSNVVRKATTSCRCISSSNVQDMEGVTPNKDKIPINKTLVSITYIEADGTEKIVQATIGKNLMEVAHDHKVELEGACGGELACSTCHLVFPKEIYDTLPPKTPEEEDMLDLAMELTETSRLGCQIRVREDFEGMVVRIPDDGF